MANYHIRKANPDDVNILSHLFDQYRIFYRKESDLRGAESFLRGRLTNDESVVFIAETDGTMAGFAQLYPLFSSTRMKRLWLLNDLYVAEEFRGQGISKALIETCHTFGIDTGACGLSLETEKTNVISNQLYHSTGWQLDQEHNYYFLNVQ